MINKNNFIRPTLSEIIYFLVCIGLTGLAYQLGCLFVERMIYWGVLAGILDWSIFVDYASRYIRSGQLYEQNIMLYGPGEPIYKFPPLFISAIIFCFQNGISEESLKFWISILHLALYFFTAAILLFGIKRKNLFLLYPFVVFFLLSSEAFFDNFVRLQLEIYVVFLVSVGIVFLIKKQYFWSGFFLGFSTGLKIYPAFFCAGLFIRRDYRALVGVAVGFLATIIISLTTINFHEHWHYFTHIVPFMLSEGIWPTVENVSVGYFAVLLNFSASQAGFIARACMLFAVVVVAAGVIFTDFYKKAAEINNAQDEALKIASGFSVLISGFVVGAQNSWWNYQLLLMIPIIVTMIAIFDRRYFSWSNLLAVLVGCLFIYAGSVEHLAQMTALSNKGFGDPNFLQPLFVNSVYLRATAGLLIYAASVYLYWRVVTDPAKKIRL